MKRIAKLKIHPSFFFFTIIIIALGYLKQLFLLILVTTIHEMSHVVTAKLLGFETEGVIITPIGEVACIKGFDFAPAIKKYIIILAGPLANIIPAMLLFLCGSYREFMYISFSIGVFNLLPFYPLDGGRLLFTFLGNRIGILRGVAYVRLITKIGIVMLCLFGFVQTILYPFNMSLIAIAAFFISIYKRESESMLFSYYTCMLNKYKRLDAGMKTKVAVFALGSSIGDIRQLFTWDYYHIVHIVENGKIVRTLTEKQVFETGVEPIE